MLDRVIRWSIDNHFLVALAAGVLLVSGTVTALRMPVDVFPDLNRPRVTIFAEAEGLAEVFKDAGFEWREPGCSMCVAMNGDVLPPGKRSASTSNRNFEGRQGYRGRTHLASPAMAALPREAAGRATTSSR